MSCTRVASNHERSLFIDLPTELRLMILRHLLVVPIDRDLQIQTAVLSVCRTIYHEGRQLMFAENTVPVSFACYGYRPTANVTVHFRTMPFPECYFQARTPYQEMHGYGERSVNMLGFSDVHSRFLSCFQKFRLEFDHCVFYGPNIPTVRAAMLYLSPILNDKHLTLEIEFIDLWTDYPQFSGWQHSTLSTRLYNIHLWCPASIFQSLRGKSVDIQVDARNLVERNLFTSLKHLMTSQQPIVDMVRILDIVTRPGERMQADHRPCIASKAVERKLNLPGLHDMLEELLISMQVAMRDSRQDEFLSLASRCKFMLTRIFLDCREGYPRVSNTVATALRALEDTLKDGVPGRGGMVVSQQSQKHANS